MSPEQRDRIVRLIKLTVADLDPDADLDEMTCAAVKAEVLRLLDVDLVTCAAALGVDMLIVNWTHRECLRQQAARARASAA